MSKKEIVNLISYLVSLLVFGLAVGFVVKQTTIREQEQIRYELELEMLEDYYSLIAKGRELEIITEIQGDYIVLLEEKIQQLFKKVVEEKDNGKDYKQDLENFEQYVELIVKYFKIDSHPDVDNFEFWLFTNHKEIYIWSLNYE
ncbi:MAG: hypothetical protein WC188_12680 [Candidatus Caldatribacteriota bacterium]